MEIFQEHDIFSLEVLASISEEDFKGEVIGPNKSALKMGCCTRLMAIHKDARSGSHLPPPLPPPPPLSPLPDIHFQATQTLRHAHTSSAGNVVLEGELIDSVGSRTVKLKLMNEVSVSTKEYNMMSILQRDPKTTVSLMGCIYL